MKQQDKALSIGYTVLYQTHSLLALEPCHTLIYHVNFKLYTESRAAVEYEDGEVLWENVSTNQSDKLFKFDDSE